MDVLSLYRAALEACSPERLMREYRAQGAGGGAQVELPRNVVAIGKCAGPLLDGFGDYDDAFVAMPEGYCPPRPAPRALVYRGGHPDMTPASFAAGRALLDFVDAHDDGRLAAGDDERRVDRRQEARRLLDAALDLLLHDEGSGAGETRRRPHERRVVGDQAHIY